VIEHAVRLSLSETIFSSHHPELNIVLPVMPTPLVQEGMPTARFQVQDVICENGIGSVALSASAKALTALRSIHFYISVT
jgi:hypothetical protein